MFPAQVSAILERLEQAGFAAYAVGGCVRDTLLGRVPQDWDVATSARPEQTAALFAGRSIPTGLQHGTVTVRQEGLSVEVTTFRADGPYSDHRRPDAVYFSDSLAEDLCRRDLTVNAMAMDRRGVLTDLHGGREDLRRGLLRCVGEPDRRFDEDALRIMRTLRFASVLGFTVEERTAAALHRRAPLLGSIAAERLLSEMDRLLCGRYVLPVLLAYPDVLGVFLPELLPCVGFDQRNRHHLYDVWGHTSRAVAAVPPEPVLRWTMLLHDVGKPPLLHRGRSGSGPFLRPPQGIGGAGGDCLPPTADGQAHRPSGGDAGAVARSGHPADGEGHRTRRPPAGRGHVPAAAGGKAGGQSGPASRLPLSSGGH